ncbi:MAG: hypothetical protein L0Y71_01490 [Gemmataceae bacterium]|nr:hypothetical protein [Gemmataceae bacterium]
MQIVQVVLFAIGTAAMVRAWRASRGTALFHAVHWGIAAWAAWGLAIFLRAALADAGAGIAHPDPFAFIALCLTGCAGVAVLGARRPQAAAWNFVVVGLLAVMVLPLVENALIGTRSLDWVRIAFLSITLAIGMLNYLPTRFGPATLLAGLGCAAEIVGVVSPELLPDRGAADAIRLCVLAAPSLARARWPSRNAVGDLDRIWLDFRDRWGLVWGQRVREQFNRAAANAGWPATLTWLGFKHQQTPDAASRAAMRDTLLALLQRFIQVEAKK